MLPSNWINKYELSKQGTSLVWNEADHTFQANCCFPKPRQNYFPYFEVFITRVSGTGYSIVAVGLGTKEISGDGVLPGWKPGSYGYHADDGYVYLGAGEGTPYGPKFGPGDVVGCGISLNNELYFTKNGKHLGVACKIKDKQLFPLVGLDHASISANFGDKPFMYNPFTNTTNPFTVEQYKGGLTTLNENTILHILRFLNHTQIALGFSRTCKKYFQLSKSNQVWKRLVWKKWRTVSPDVPIPSYYEFYKNRTQKLQQNRGKTTLIENCFKWEFECPATLDKLTRTGNPEIDHCSVCKKDVHLVHNMDQLKEKVAAKQCVAIDFGNKEITSRTRPIRMMGRMVSRR